MNQSKLNKKNSSYWNEVCGSNLARTLKITKITPKNLSVFDKAYWQMYPYLKNYVIKEDLEDKQVLEIGFGYGSLGQLIIDRGGNYYGIDIARGPVELMKYRLSLLGNKNSKKIKIGSALKLPLKDNSFDYVYSIGCFHHTGNIQKAINEAHRILKPGGKALIMFYNRYSIRRIMLVIKIYIKSLFGKSDAKDINKIISASYDLNEQGEVSPYTDFISILEIKNIFRNFSGIKIDIQNYDKFAINTPKGQIIIPKKLFLNNLARILGLDIYATAIK